MSIPLTSLYLKSLFYYENERTVTPSAHGAKKIEIENYDAQKQNSTIDQNHKELKTECIQLVKYR